MKAFESPTANAPQWRWWTCPYFQGDIMSDRQTEWPAKVTGIIRTWEMSGEIK
jgi:hypothetical protein